MYGWTNGENIPYGNAQVGFYANEDRYRSNLTEILNKVQYLIGYVKTKGDADKEFATAVLMDMSVLINEVIRDRDEICNLERSVLDALHLNDALGRITRLEERLNVVEKIQNGESDELSTSTISKLLDIAEGKEDDNKSV